jgi:mRNA-degrading endonuclease RelE of RelBE toxin-antitoxin system
MAYDLQITWQPEVAIQSLSRLDREDVDRTLERIRALDLQSIPQVYRVHGRPGEPEYHVIRVNDRLRILFTVEHDRKLVIVRDLADARTFRRSG